MRYQSLIDRETMPKVAPLKVAAHSNVSLSVASESPSGLGIQAGTT